MKKKRISGNVIDYFWISDLPLSVIACLCLALLFYSEGEDYHVFFYIVLPLAVLINLARYCLMALKKPKTLYIDSEWLYFGKDRVSPDLVIAVKPFYQDMYRLPNLHWLEFKVKEDEKTIIYNVPTKPNSILRLNKNSPTLEVLIRQFPAFKDKLVKESRLYS